MREVAAKAATESAAGLSKIMDDIAGLRAAKPPPIAAGGYRVLKVRGARPTRAGKIAPLPAKPMRVRGFLTALFAGGLGLAVLAGPVTCPACDSVRAGGGLDAQRILSRLDYTRDLPADAAAPETAPVAQADLPAASDHTGAPAVAAVALAEPEDSAASVATSTGAILPEPDRDAEARPAAGAAQTIRQTSKLPDAIEQLRDKGAPETEVAAVAVETEPEAPLPPVGASTLPLKSTTAAEPEEPVHRASGPHKHVSSKQRRAKARAPAMTTAPKLYAPNKYRQVPGWAEKMFETPWQSKAFAFQ